VRQSVHPQQRILWRRGGPTLADGVAGAPVRASRELASRPDIIGDIPDIMSTDPGDGERATRRARLYRALDLSWAACAIGFLLPLLAFLAVLIACEDSRPVFVRYRHVRKDGGHQDLLRFRTACQDLRRSPLGSVLHTTGLDQLPMLFSVLKGELPVCGRYSWRQVTAWLSDTRTL
jgi:lipopolysaccharide/colanic/teichoic acid biosynthesis glycosyltransferase